MMRKPLQGLRFIQCVEGLRPIRTNIMNTVANSLVCDVFRPQKIYLIAKRDDFVGFLRPERAARFSAGQRPASARKMMFSPVRAARMMRKPLQGLHFTHFFEGLRPIRTNLTVKNFESALKGQPALAQGNALRMECVTCKPCKGFRIIVRCERLYMRTRPRSLITPPRPPFFQ